MRLIYLSLVIAVSIEANSACFAGVVVGDTYTIAPLAGDGSGRIDFSLTSDPTTVPVLGTGHIVGTSLNGATITSSGEVQVNSNGTETLTLKLTALGGAQLFAPAGPFDTFNQAFIGFGAAAGPNGREINFEPMMVPALAPGKTTFAEIELYDPNGNSPSGPFRISETSSMFSIVPSGNSTKLSFQAFVGPTHTTPVVSEVQIRVTYAATAVPEPGPTMLLSTVFVFAILLRRRIRG